MTTNIDIDLTSIPHPKDCYQVPLTVQIPPRTPFWGISPSGSTTWFPHGLDRMIANRGSDGKTYLTREPLGVRPMLTSADSPIVITKYTTDGGDIAYCNVVANCEPESATWVIVNQAGKTDWIYGPDILEWHPVIVTKSGFGVWDERDKRDRVNEDGDRVEWLPVTEKWVVRAFGGRSFGSLAAIRNSCGEDYLTGFWDEEGGEE